MNVTIFVVYVGSGEDRVNKFDVLSELINFLVNGWFWSLLDRQFIKLLLTENE